jgi:hypothetical protein
VDAYSKTIWVNDQAPALNAVNMNKIEQGIYDAITNTITTVIDTYQILTTDETVVCNKSSAFTAKLPIAVVGHLFHIKNIGAGVVTLEGVSTVTDTIDGGSSQLIYQYESLTAQCNAANSWVIL